MVHLVKDVVCTIFIFYYFKHKIGVDLLERSIFAFVLKRIVIIAVLILLYIIY